MNVDLIKEEIIIINNNYKNNIVNINAMNVDYFKERLFNINMETEMNIIESIDSKEKDKMKLDDKYILLLFWRNSDNDRGKHIVISDYSKRKCEFKMNLKALNSTNSNIFYKIIKINNNILNAKNIIHIILFISHDTDIELIAHGIFARSTTYKKLRHIKNILSSFEENENNIGKLNSNNTGTWNPIIID